MSGRVARAALEGPSPAARRAARAGLYVHVPFCARRCEYCDFATGTLSEHAVERYLAAMTLEIDARAPMAARTTFSSVFFGGGTPSALSARSFQRLWSGLRAAFTIAADAEITLEANPESVRPALLESWAAAGVNRLSIGIQSFHGDELARLGRIHDATGARLAIRRARAAGFRRLSLDLMFAFPGHDARRWAETVAAAVALGPEHVSAYCFIPEPGTPMGDAVAAGELALAGPDEQADLYEQATAMLAAAGFACYETSNFCTPEREARHNLVYWLVRPYLGLGPSAHGHLAGVRYGNHASLSHWATALERGAGADATRERVGADEQAIEIMMLGLRLAGGLVPGDYPVRWNDVARRYGEAFRQAEAAGRLERAGKGWRIPHRHRFVADDVIAWIEARARSVEVDRLPDRSLSLTTCPSLRFPAI